MDLLYQGPDILKLIPQRNPIVMVDSFYGIENTVSRSSLTIMDDNIFIEFGGVLSELGMIEHVAQSAAAREGYEAICSGNKPAVGYIGAISNLKVKGSAKVGEILSTDLKPLYQLGDVILFHADVRIAELSVLECDMKVFLKKE